MIERMILSSKEEQYAPPEKEIAITVVDDHVFITVYKVDDMGGKKVEYEVPTLDFDDLCVTLWASAGSDRNWGRPKC